MSLRCGMRVEPASASHSNHVTMRIHAEKQRTSEYRAERVGKCATPSANRLKLLILSRCPSSTVGRRVGAMKRRGGPYLRPRSHDRSRSAQSSSWSWRRVAGPWCDADVRRADLKMRVGEHARDRSKECQIASQSGEASKGGPTRSTDATQGTREATGPLSRWT